MKVAFLVHQFPALSESFILEQITGLLDRGVDVRIYAETRLPEPARHPSIDAYGLLDRSRYARTPERMARRWLRLPAIALRHLPRRPGVLLTALNPAVCGRSALTLQSLYTALAFLDHGGFDVLHCHFGPNGNLGTQLREMGLVRCPIVTSFHGYDANMVDDRTTYARLFRDGERFTANSEYTRRRLLRLGCPGDRIVILPEAVNLRRIRFSPRRWSPGSPVRLLTVGRLTEKKGHPYALRAVARLIRERPDLEIRYTIVGGGPMESELRALVSELGVSGRVELAGARNQEEVARLMEESHLFLLASVTAANRDREGQALVLQEAQASGLPVVATRHNGIPEGLREGVSGLLAPERNADALAALLRGLLDRPESWEAMGRAGRAFVEAKYDPDLLADRLLALYGELAGRASPGRGPNRPAQ